MSKMKSHDHYANQTGSQQVMGKLSPSSVGKVGVTSLMGKPSPAKSNNSPGIMPAKHSTKGSRKTETAVSPDTNTSNGGM